MTKRRANSRAKLFSTNAEAFGVEPELAFLMTTEPMWGEIRDGICNLNRGILTGRPSFPIAQVIENLQALQELLNQRYGKFD